MSGGRICIVLLVISMSLSAVPLFASGPDAAGTPDPPSPSRAYGTSGGWPMFMADNNHTGHVSAPVPMDSSTLWSLTIAGLKPTNSPVVYGGLAFIGSGDTKVRGVDIDTGKVVWTVSSSGPVSATPTAYDGDLYFGSDDGYAYSFDIATQTRNWKVDLGATEIYSTPTVNAGMVLIGTHTLQYSNFFALRTSDGSTIWNLTMDGETNFWGFKSSAAVNGDRVYVGDGAGVLYCVDADGFADGNDGITSEPDASAPHADIIWRTALDSAIIGSPTLAEGFVFIGSSAGWYYKIDSSDGSELYKVRLGSGEYPSISTTPSYHNGTLFITSKRDRGAGLTGGSVYAIDTQTDAILWRFNITQTLIESSPVITNEYLFFAARDSKIYCLRTDPNRENERLFWSKDVGSPVTSTAAIAHGRIFIARPDPYGDGKLIAFGTPDPYVSSFDVSDSYMLEGEVVDLIIHLKNNGTVSTVCDLQFKATSLNYMEQELIGRINGVTVNAYDEVIVTIPWRAVKDFPYLDCSIIKAEPGNRLTSNDNMTVVVQVESAVEGYWTSAGGGPGQDGAARKSVDSNRTLWEKDYSFGWSGDQEGLWFDSFGGTGSPVSIGSTVYYVDPDGGLTSLYHEEDTLSPSIGWRYHNSSVRFLGRPALLVDREQSQAFPNKVFVVGDDDNLWAFDWIGFQDGKNDGPFIAEDSKGPEAGDVLWRVPLAHMADSPITVSAANVLLRDESGRIVAFDDDTGRIEWWYQAGTDAPFASSIWDVFVAKNDTVILLDAGNGSMERSIPLSGIVEGDILSIAFRGQNLIVTSEGGLALVDADPDDNADGRIDKKDLDEGIPDNLSLGRDIIWVHDLPEGPSTPPALDYPGGRIAICTDWTLVVISMSNGTAVAYLPLGGQPTGRIVSGDRSFYVMVGSSPCRLLAYRGTEQAVPEYIWSLDFNTSAPMGAPAISGGAMVISLAEGRIFSVGATNSAPVARIGRPLQGMLVFPDELIEIDASGSFDVQGDPLTYRWYLEGDDAPLYEGASPRANITIQGIGKVRLILRVMDDMRAYSEDSVNITVLKRVIEDYPNFVYNVWIHVSYGISDPNGKGYATFDVPEGATSDRRIVFLIDLDFKLLQQYALYKFEFANISISLSGKVFPIKMEMDRLGIFFRDEASGIWDRAPRTGHIQEDGTVYGNFTSLEKGTYALGILDNRVPDLRHKGMGEDIAKSVSGSGYDLRVEYRDLDGDEPKTFKLVLDNETSYSVSNDGFLKDYKTFTYFQASSVMLAPGIHTYFFEASDGSFTVKSRYYQLEIANQKPIIVLKSPTEPVGKGKVALFDATASYDPDGSPVEFSWDFDLSNGIQREEVKGKVDHVYYEVGIYTVTLTITDGVETAVKSITVTVIEDEKENETIDQTTLFLLLLAFVAILGVALAVFLVLTRKEKERPAGDVKTAGWACPECGVRADRGSSDCDRCGYEYDPNDFTSGSHGPRKGYLDNEM
jgi:outer membrane protein assembly factor BamB